MRQHGSRRCTRKTAACMLSRFWKVRLSLAQQQVPPSVCRATVSALQLSWQPHQPSYTLTLSSWHTEPYLHCFMWAALRMVVRFQLCMCRFACQRQVDRLAQILTSALACTCSAAGHGAVAQRVCAGGVRQRPHGRGGAPAQQVCRCTACSCRCACSTLRRCTAYDLSTVSSS